MVVLMHWLTIKNWGSCSLLKFCLLYVFFYVYEKISAVTGAHYFPLLLLNVICSLEMHRAIWLPFGWQIIKLEVSRNRATCLFW